MNKDCAVYKSADVIGKKWTLLILLELYKGEKWKRYTKLKNKLMNITPKILSARLKELEKYKLIEKKVDNREFPIKSEYSLTKSGEEFIKVIEEMKKWSVKWGGESACKDKECKYCDF